MDVLTGIMLFNARAPEVESPKGRNNKMAHAQ